MLRSCSLEGREGRFWLVRSSREHSRVQPMEPPDAPTELVRTASVYDVREEDVVGGEYNSRVTRVLRVFRDDLGQREDRNWAQRLLEMADGIGAGRHVGPVVSCQCDRERCVPASPRRLAWMIRNADRLAPRDGREWQRYDLVINHPERERWLQQLDDGLCCGVPRILILEGSTCCDCLIEAERAFIWIEGKRFDWIDPARKWDITRDQLARNAEAAMILADQAKKDFYLIICHEGRLKHHEEALITGYRNQTWRAGLPHLTDEERQRISQRIGTLTWQQIAEAWNIDLPR